MLTHRHPCPECGRKSRLNPDLTFPKHRSARDRRRVCRQSGKVLPETKLGLMPRPFLGDDEEVST